VSIWYPSWAFYVETHQIMLEQFGGYPGIYQTSRSAFEAIMEEVKATEGIFRQAGIMLSKLRRVRLVEDAQKRTAYVLTTTFLEKNGEKMSVSDPEKVNSFMKDMLKYSLDEIVEWIKDGKVPEEP